jgi:Ca2+-binding RTX toxin-like protein
MSITITHAGKIYVVPGETYIISPDLKGTVEFDAKSGDPKPVDFNIVLSDSPTHGYDVKIDIDDPYELSPTLTIADGYNGPNTEIYLKDATDSDIIIGDDVIIKKLEASEKGQDRVEVGAFDRDELIKLHQLELDGNGNDSAGDKLTLDISWMTPDELAKLEAELAKEGFSSDGMGGWTSKDEDGNDVRVKYDLDGDGHEDFELKLDNWEHITLSDGGAAGPAGPDFVVSGSEDADLIDLAYDGDPEGDMIDANDNATGGNEDVVDAGAGDDTVLAGEADDTVFAGSGDDSVEGEGGNDVIYGDTSLGTATGTGAVRESLNWSQAPDPNGPSPIENGDPITGFTQNTGSVDVTFSVLTPSAVVLNEYETDTQNISGIDSGAEAIDANSSFNSETRGNGNSESYALDFSQAVENVSFRINDIDGDGVVKIKAFDADNNPIEIELTAGSELTLQNNDGVPGADTAVSDGGYLEDTSSEYSLLVEIAGPVARIEIEHSQAGSDNSGVNITDVFFDVPMAADPEGPGNDTLDGGDGDDLIYGETGDDSITGGTGNDTLYGDDAEPGTPIGPNLIVNGSFEDTTGATGTGYGFVADGAIPAWTEAGGADFDIHNDGRGGVNPTDGNNWLDLDASPGNVRVGQDVAGVQDGVSYQLTFDAGDSSAEPQSGSGENLVNVYWGGVLIATIDPPPGGMSNYVFTVEGGAGDGTNRLEFEGTGDEDNFGASIDSVSLVQLSSSTGPAGNDTIEGEAGDDVIFGQGGDDLLSGGIGNDSVLGGAGNDELRGNAGNDTLEGGDGDDSMGGAEGDDSLLGGAGEDTLTGGSGNDTLDGGADNDTINGNSGNDSITDFDGNNLINAGIDGLPDLGFPFVPGTADLNPDDDKDTVITGAGNDTINTGDDADVIDAGDGNNVIDAGFDADSITSGSGNDFIVSGEGSDTVSSGDGDDTIFGGIGAGGDSVNLIDDNVNPVNNDPIPGNVIDSLSNGDDFIDAGAGNDQVFGEDDDDTIFGGAGNDTLDGGIDDDVIDGGAGDDKIIGGQGADSLSGGTGNDTFTVGTFTDPIFGDTYVEGIGDTIVGGEDDDDGDIDVLDLTGSGPLKVVFDDSVDPGGTPGESGTVTFFTDNTQTTVAGTLTFSEIENVIPCFTPGALIATPKGEVPVETLREGDKVITRDNGIQEIRWVGSRTLNREELGRAPNLRPVLIKAGSLGHGLPERDMVVSPQHRVLIAGDRSQLYFEESEVLVAAKHLVNSRSIVAMDTLRTTYIHFMFDRHEVVLSDGAWTESFQPGDQTLGAMGQDTRDEIVALFPELATAEGVSDYAAARRSLKAHEARLLQL